MTENTEWVNQNERIMAICLSQRTGKLISPMCASLLGGMQSPCACIEAKYIWI